MKRYRLKPRFYVIAATAGLLITSFSLVHIDKVCSANVPSETTPVVIEEVKEPEPELLGEYKITHYCSCEICCGVWAENRPIDESGQEIVTTASGAVSEPGRTIAVDPDVIPLGSTVIIDGIEYIAQDVGGAIKGARIDIYCASHEEALNKGVIYADVYKGV